jgi:hypothetical protein
VRPCELRRFAGDMGFVAAPLTTSVLLGGNVVAAALLTEDSFWGVGLGASATDAARDSGTDEVSVRVLVAVVDAAEVRRRGAAAVGLAFCIGTAGLKGSIGEYWVAASTPTYCFGVRLWCGDWDGPWAESFGVAVAATECFEWRRGRFAVTFGESCGEVRLGA